METGLQWYELRDSVYSKQFGRAEELIRANPKLLTWTNGIGETVLHYLAVENDIEGVAWLHAHGFSLHSEFGTPMVFEVATLGHKGLLLWLAQNGVDFSVVDEEGRGIFECLLDGLGQELMEPSKDERAKTYWRQREETLRFLLENIPGISMTDEQRTLLRALSARATQ